MTQLQTWWHNPPATLSLINNKNEFMCYFCFLKMWKKQRIQVFGYLALKFGDLMS